MIVHKGLSSDLSKDSASSCSSLGHSIKTDSSLCSITNVCNEHTADMCISFKNLTYTVVNAANKKEKLALLDSVNGFFNAGEMSALMGPSGSGKTTCLDILSGRKTTGSIKGNVFIGGIKPTSAFYRRYTGYVEQHDTLIPSLTVEQMLLYTAQLKRPWHEPAVAKRKLVDSIIQALALDSCRNRLIGSALHRGISGGQAKRVNIGIALVSQPKVLFLDEPTTGLDTCTSNEVMTYVKALTTTGITICATIHSPTAYAFGLFDRLLLLLSGRVVYFGPNGSAAVDFFQKRFPELEGIPEGGNPAEWIVDITTKADRDNRGGKFAEAYTTSQLAVDNTQIIDQLSAAHVLLRAESLKTLQVTCATTTPPWWAFWVLFRYRTLQDWSTPTFWLTRIADKTIFCFIIFTIFWGLGSGTTTGDWANISAVLFMWAILPAYGAACCVPTLITDRPLYVRERNDGLYRPITYLCSRMVCEGAVAFVVSIATSTVVWFALQLQGLWVLFWLSYLTTLIYGIVLAYCVAAVSPNLAVANVVAPSIVTLQMYFAGYIISQNDIPVYWRWMSYVAALRYPWGALMQNQFGGCCMAPFLNGVTVLEYYNFTGVNPWAWLAIEFAFIAVCFVGCWAALAYIKHQRR